MGAGTDIALAQWRPSYKRAAVMQSLLAVVGLLTAVVAFVLGRGKPALVGGLFLISVAPWTLIVIIPTNRRLLDPSRSGASPGRGQGADPTLHAREQRRRPACTQLCTQHAVTKAPEHRARGLS